MLFHTTLRCVPGICAVLLVLNIGALARTTSSDVAVEYSSSGSSDGANEMATISNNDDYLTITTKQNPTDMTRNTTHSMEPLLPPLLDHRLFYTRRRWREIDGTYDGNKLESFEVDHSKIAEYYFKHFHNGEIWMLRMDNRPSVIYEIWPKLAEIFNAKKGIVHKTNRVIDVGLYAGVGGVGIVVNSIMLTVILLNKDQQTPPNILLCSVSIGDICYIIFDAVFQLLSDHYKDYISLNDHFCKSATHISIALYCLTVLHNTAIAMERYIAISWPMKVVTLASKKRSMKIGAGLWILAFVLPSPLTYFTYLIGHGVDSTCRYVFPYETWEMKLLVVYDVGMLFMLPMCIMIFAYSSATFTLVKSIGNSKCMTTENANAKIETALVSRLQVIKRLWVICVLFFLSWLPRCITSLANVTNRQRTRQDLERIFNSGAITNVQRRLVRISYLNSAMNPIVLFIMSKTFRHHTIRLITCGKVLLKSEDERVTPMKSSTGNSLDKTAISCIDGTRRKAI